MKALKVLGCFCVAVALAAPIRPTYAADVWLTGNVTNMTSHAGGLLLILDSGVPTNCQGTQYGWMLIKAENKVMIALLLTMYAMGKKTATVYTSAIGANAYCEINQFDPVE